MALLKIKHEGNIKEVFVASMDVSDLATVELIPGAATAMRQVKMGATGNEHLVAGIARGGVSSGALVRVITHGFVSGVVIATSAVQAGDRLMIATSGRVNPFNTFTPAGLVSGYIASGFLSGVLSGFGYPLSGYATMAALYTGKVLGRAITSGGSGAAIQMLVTLE